MTKQWNHTFNERSFHPTGKSQDTAFSPGPTPWGNGWCFVGSRWFCKTHGGGNANKPWGLAMTGLNLHWMASSGPWEFFSLWREGVWGFHLCMGMKSLSWLHGWCERWIFPMAFSWLDLLQYFFPMLANGKRSVLTDATNIDHVCEFGFSIHFFPWVY